MYIKLAAIHAHKPLNGKAGEGALLQRNASRPSISGHRCVPFHGRVHIEVKQGPVKTVNDPLRVHVGHSQRLLD